MQYLVSVIHDQAGLATPDEMAAIDVFNERLQAEGHWVFAGGLASPSTATVIDNRGAEALVTDGPSWSPRSTSPASGSSRPPTSTWRSSWPPRGRRPATGRSRYDRSWPREHGRRPGSDHPGPPRGVGPGGRRLGPAPRAYDGEGQHTQQQGDRDGLQDDGGTQRTSSNAGAGRSRPCGRRRLPHSSWGWRRTRRRTTSRKTSSRPRTSSISCRTLSAIGAMTALTPERAGAVGWCQCWHVRSAHGRWVDRDTRTRRWVGRSVGERRGVRVARAPVGPGGAAH